MWLVKECHEVVGDLAETLSLLLDCSGEGTDAPLHQLIEQEVIPLQDWDDSVRFQLIRKLWTQFDRDQCFVFNKIIAGAFRVGVSRTLVIRALANAAGIEPAIMAHRVMGPWNPATNAFQCFLSPADAAREPSQPYPFYLASPIEGEPAEMGPLESWQVEWKWDGIRCQLIKRQSQVLLWSRGEDLVTETFPELAQAAARLPDGTVLDGEILAWEDDHPLPFTVLQRRLGRRKVSVDIMRQAPVAFLAYDCMESDGEDIRDHPLTDRRKKLEQLVRGLNSDCILLSSVITARSWEELSQGWLTARDRGVEGFMLKRRSSPYKAGRVKGDWWKWKVDPLTVDAVMIYAQSGHGRRANLFTDYTFAVWDDDALVPIAKAYSGLTDQEINKIDYWVKRNSLAKHGPVRVVKPAIVMELAFEGIQESTRHRSGIALRFPRISRWRSDKTAQEANTLQDLRAMLSRYGAPRGKSG